ncbi:MAG: MOSC domain-containing protein [Alphaproteobacteria bacterium]
MRVVGTIEGLWRYPVKSMAGETLMEAYMGFSGIYGDRRYAFKNTAARKGFPYLNATVQPQMLLFRPQYRFPAKAGRPPNLLEAMSIAPGVNPMDPEPGDLALDVVTPDGELARIDDPALRTMLGEGLRGENHISLVNSDRSLTDCRPVSLMGLQTVRQIGEELGGQVDKRRFRANIYVDIASDNGFAEDEWVGRRLRLGHKAEITVLERDPCCKIMSLDPDTGEHDPAILRKLAQRHDAYAGIYCAVLVEGILSVGDIVEVAD